MSHTTQKLLSVTAALALSASSVFAQSSDAQSQTDADKGDHPAAWLGTMSYFAGDMPFAPSVGVPMQRLGAGDAWWAGDMPFAPSVGVPMQRLGAGDAWWAGDMPFAPSVGVPMRRLGAGDAWWAGDMPFAPSVGVPMQQLGSGITWGAPYGAPVRYVPVPQYIYVPVAARSGQASQATASAAAPPQPVVCLVKGATDDADVAVIAQSESACTQIDGTVTTSPNTN